MEVAEQLLLQHRLQMVEQQQLQQRRTQRQTQQRRVAVPEPHRPVTDHPPYAEMVGMALRALAEPGGSSERSISDYIVSTFSGLPQAHVKVLPYYLGKLVSSGYLSVPSPGRYLLSEDPNPESLPHHRRLRPEIAAATPVDAHGAPPALRRRGRPPKNRVATAVPVERPSSPVRRPRGRPRKHPLSLPPPPPPPPRDDAVQKRKMAVRRGTKPSNSSSVGPRSSNEKKEEEDSGRSQSQPSEDASCVSNGLSLAPMSLNYEADEEPLFLDPIQCSPEEELVWGLPMQPEPEAELWLPSTSAAAPKLEQPAMPKAELFGGRVPAEQLVVHRDPMQSPIPKEVDSGDRSRAS